MVKWLSMKADKGSSETSERLALLEEGNAAMSENQETARIIVQSKSMAVGSLLALFFGPLGLFYSSVPGALIMLVVSVIVAFFTLGLGLLIIPVLSVLWAAIAISSHNNKLLG